MNRDSDFRKTVPAMALCAVALWLTALPVRAGAKIDLHLPCRSGEACLELPSVWTWEETVTVAALPALSLGREEILDAEPREAPGDLSLVLRLDAGAAERFHRVTSENVGRRLALVFDGRVYSSPRIRAPVPDGELLVSLNGGRRPFKALADALGVRDKLEKRRVERRRRQERAYTIYMALMIAGLLVGAGYVALPSVLPRRGTEE